MDNAEVEVVDLDRDQGIYQIHIPSAVFSGEEGGGFFCRITFSCDDDDAYDVLLRVTGTSEDYRVLVYDADGNARVEPDVAQQVLVLLREFAA